MITDKDIEAKATEFGIPPIAVEKDYVYGWLLNSIFTESDLSKLLVLKGGQAIRKCYLPNTRFSRDLDFSSTSHIDARSLEQKLRTVCARIEKQTGITFLDRIVTRDKELPIPGVEALEVRIYFKGFYGEEDLTLRTQMDITQFDRIYLPIQRKPLLHPYPDAASCNAFIPCQKLEEILASKLTALLHRRRPGDLFDLLYAIIIAKDYPVSRREVLVTFLQKSIFEPNPSRAKDELLSLPIADFESSWPLLVVPSVVAFGFRLVIEHFRSLIESIFSSGEPATNSSSLLSGARNIVRSMHSFRSDIHAFRFANRGAIISAGRRGHMVDLIYDGVRRIVEPYKLEYYVRKSDGIGSEYFWGYDTSGGRSGKVGIKMFFANKIQSVSETDMSFLPRYPVEL